MKNSEEPKGHSAFPVYLQRTGDQPALRWLGKRLREVRGNKTATDIAKKTGVPISEIRSMERGDFRLNLGRVRDVILQGYGQKLTDLLSECYEAHKAQFNPQGKRLFRRDYLYSLRLSRSKSGKGTTPLLIGGDSKNFVWAIPMRELRDQPVVTEFLELAPSRKRNPVGFTPENSHPGVEVVHVIHGRVSVHMSPGSEAGFDSTLASGDSVHFHSRYGHNIENTEKGTSALLFIVRLPEL